jgi:hypothetical protein
MSPLLAQSGRIEVGSRTDGESHAAIEQSCGKASMNRAGGIEMPRMGFCDGNNAALGNLDNVVAERLRHRVQGQRAVDEPLNIFEAAHCSLLVVVDDAEALASREFRHEFHRELVGRHTHDRIAAIDLRSRKSLDNGR